jgi:thiamine-phosphate pyrophosphorylase
VDWVQIRDRELSGRDWLAFAREIAAAARGARVVVNRRIDVALAIGADGVHLGFDALAPADAARLLPPDVLIGVSAHAPREVFEARRSGATYAHLAPIWDPLSKPAERPALGLAALEDASAAGLTLLAQGGLTSERCARALSAGASGVAVTGDILLADDPSAAARALREALDG